jgi:hypothetical protein
MVSHSWTETQITQSHLRLTSTVLKCFTKFMKVTQDNRPSFKTDRYRSDLTCKNTPGEVWDRAPPLPVNPTVSNAARAAGRVCRNIQRPTSLNIHNQPSQTSLQNEKTAKSRSACCYKSCIRILWFQGTQREQTLPVAIITWTPIFIAALKAFAVFIVILLLPLSSVPI